jgi:hypothetical protein
VIEWEGSDEKGGGDDDDFASQSTEAHCIGKKTALFEPFIYKMHSFTKTGSGQT